MNGNKTAAMVLIIIGALNVAYGLYRVFAMEQSMLPLVPVGLVFSAIGVLMITRPGTQDSRDSGNSGED
ncbi:MAG: hypothetical protein HKO64_11415 [Xanthomonadales bacterium]|nr:hypothetical protein [Xanthomonadales bacterium]NNL96221.1 hypothetical protein [Xanthomonadales bacterium]